MKTLRERYISALISQGYSEVKRTSKFVCMGRPGAINLYVGKAGSLRYGQTIAESYPVTDARKALLLAGHAI